MLDSLTTAAGVTTSLTYDGSLPTGNSTTGDGDGSDAAPVTLSYDSAMRPTGQQIGGGSVLSYTYNADDQITNAGPEHWTFDATTGDATSAVAGKSTTRFGFDTRGNQSSQQAVVTGTGSEAPVLSETLVRDNDDRITSRTEQVGAAAPQTQGFAYDAAGRLTGVTVNGAQTETYGYNSTGGLISRGTGTLAAWIHLDGYGRPTSTADGIAATWTTDGELSQLTRPGTGATNITYDGFGRIKQLTLPDGTAGTYTCDGMGHRSALRVAGTVQRRYVFSPGALFPAARVTASGEVLERYVYASQSHVPELVMRRDGQTLRLITDSLGSVRAVIDVDTGTVVERLAYDAYGRVTQDTAPGTQPFGFKGALSDPIAEGAGLIWMGTRAYVPSLARFATPDPAGIAATWNEHDAFAGDPINLIDADGLAPDWLWHVSDVVVGFGDAASFGLSNKIRDRIGGNENVNKCSWSYFAGGVAGAYAGGEGLARGAIGIGRGLLANAGRIGTGLRTLGARLFDETGSIGGWGTGRVGPDAPNLTTVVKTRPDPGLDGGVSSHLIEKSDGKTISVTHRVTVEKKVVHQHQIHKGKYGELRQFPNDWVEHPDI